MKKSNPLKRYNFWPPFFGANITIDHVSDDFREATVSLRQRWWNSNPNGTNFGGSISAMTDPFYAMMIMKNLGPRYVVWDKKAVIDFKKPGAGRLTAEFKLTQERIDEIKAEVKETGKANPEFLVQVKDESGQVVAEALRTVHVRSQKYDAYKLNLGILNEIIHFER